MTSISRFYERGVARSFAREPFRPEAALAAIVQPDQAEDDEQDRRHERDDAERRGRCLCEHRRQRVAGERREGGLTARGFDLGPIEDLAHLRQQEVGRERTGSADKPHAEGAASREPL